MQPLLARLKEILGWVLIAGPVLLLFLGGAYSWPAIHFTRGREPWLTFLLACGLTTTVFGVGLAEAVPVPILSGVWVLALLALALARRLYGALDHNLERFGIVHAFTLVALILVVSWSARSAAP
jgi:hypothetical protein